jgi:tetratricopeptide (TPR) repeat protein
VILAAGLGFLSLTAFGQVGFEQDERMLVQKYKASIAKLKEGKALFLKEKYDRAEKKLQESLTIFPKNPDAHYLMAQIALSRGDVDAALSSIESAEASFTETRQLYTFYHQEMMVELRDQKGRVEESVRNRENTLAELRSRTRSDSTDSAISSAEGQLQQERSLLGKIDQQLRDPIPENPAIPAGYHYIHGNILFKFKRFQEAADQYLETIRLDPRHEFAYNNVASIYFGIGQFQKALDFLLKAEANGVKVNAAFKKDLEDRLAKR